MAATASSNRSIQHPLLPGAAPAASGCFRWLVIGAALACVLVLIVQRMALSVAIIPWAAECGWTAVQQQAQLGAFSIGYLVTMIPGALAASHYTAHAPALGAVLVLSSLASAATPLADCDHTRAALLRVVLGLAQGPMFPVVSGLVGQWARPSEYSRASGFISVGANLGVLVAFPLASLLCASSYGWVRPPALPCASRVFMACCADAGEHGAGSQRASFYGPALAAGPFLVLLLVFGASTPRSSKWVGAAETALLAAEKPGGDTVVSVRWAALLQEPVVWSVTLNFFTINWAAWVLLSELPIYLTQVCMQHRLFDRE